MRNLLHNRLRGQRFDNIAAACQLIFEELVVQWVKNAVAATGIHKVCCSGGAFLNVKANKLIRELPGVQSTVVGYTGGDVPNATYRNHGTHAEAIAIEFDPAQLSYRKLLEFGMEGQRWLDLGRQNLFTDLTTLRAHDPEFNFFVANKSQLLPIPTAEIKTASSICGPRGKEPEPIRYRAAPIPRPCLPGIPPRTPSIRAPPPEAGAPGLPYRICEARGSGLRPPEGLLSPSK